ICSNVGGLADLVRHGENGFIMSPGDVEAMAKYIMTLAQDSLCREQMGLRNAKKIRDFYSLQAVATQVSHLYREVVCQPRLRSLSAGSRVRNLPHESIHNC